MKRIGKGKVPAANVTVNQSAISRGKVGIVGLNLVLDTKIGQGSVVGIATGYGLDGPGIESLWEARFSAPVQTSPGAHPASCTMGTGSFPGVKSGQGVTLTPHLLLVPCARKGRAIPLLPLWAVRPVQSLSACTRVTFTLDAKNVWRGQICTERSLLQP